VVCADGKGGTWLKGFADADDFADADGKVVMNYWQAQAQARVLARGEGQEIAGDRPITVEEALAAYEGDLKARGGDLHSVARVRLHLSAKIAGAPVALLKANDLLRWRNGLRKSLAAGSVNRISNSFKAALNLAADADSRLSRHAWSVGLKAVPGGSAARNVILPVDAIHRLVSEAYAISEEFGLLVEVHAVTGARTGQITQLTVQDVQASRVDPRLMMPASRKGKGEKRITHQPVAIPKALTLKLKQAGKGRAPHEPLLLKPSGEAWAKSDHSRLFSRAVVQAGLDPKKVTAYSLRHSSVVRMLLANVPIRVVATAHDTSVAMIEKNYSVHIADHADELLRPTLIDFNKTAGGNIVSLGRKS
jgi:integrase